jgi:ribonuclease Z
MRKISRRDALKVSGATATALALSSGVTGAFAQGGGTSNINSYFTSLRPYFPGKEPLAADEMRITFLGTWFAERLSQACNSIFVELGNGDTFVFDCGPGVLAKYNAMGIPQSKLDKVFLTHLHADHMTELGMLFGFGSSYKRMKPLYVWGTKPSGIGEPVTGRVFDDGITAYCTHLREAFRWHTESQSFLTSTVQNWTPPAWAPQDKVDSFDLVPFELDWRIEGGIAYQDNGVTITHFPSVHNRAGAIGYKLEWNGLSMIFTGDTKPNQYVIRAAKPGVDVLVHEMTTQPEVWCEKFMGLHKGDPGWDQALQVQKAIQESSHTLDKAYGYVLNQIAKTGVAPRLAVATHFPAADDTIRPALANVRRWYPNGDFVITSDLMVLIVSKTTIQQRRAVVSDYSWPPIVQLPAGTPAAAKYASATEQLDPVQLAETIESTAYDAK